MLVEGLYDLSSQRTKQSHLFSCFSHDSHMANASLKSRYITSSEDHFSLGMIGPSIYLLSSSLLNASQQQPVGCGVSSSPSLSVFGFYPASLSLPILNILELTLSLQFFQSIVVSGDSLQCSHQNFACKGLNSKGHNIDFSIIQGAHDNKNSLCT